MPFCSTTTEATESTDDTDENSDASTDDVTTSEQATIPMVNVVGLYKTAAEEELKKAGFTNYTFETKKDNDVQEGYVISQSVDEGTAVSADEEIVVTVSEGKEDKEVPEVRGYSDDQATTLLTEAGFTVTHGYEYALEFSRARKMENRSLGYRFFRGLYARWCSRLVTLAQKETSTR